MGDFSVGKMEVNLCAKRTVIGIIHPHVLVSIDSVLDNFVRSTKVFDNFGVIFVGINKVDSFIDVFPNSKSIDPSD